MPILHHHLWGCKEQKHPAIKWCMKRLLVHIVGENIKDLRKTRGLTQEQLAEMIKTSYKYMQRIEGRTPPDIRLSTVQKIAKALDTTPSKLLAE